MRFKTYSPFSIAVLQLSSATIRPKNWAEVDIWELISIDFKQITKHHAI